MAYAVLRFEKRKGGSASGISNHHERKKETYYSNPDVDTGKSHLNYHIVNPESTYHQEINYRIEQAGCRVKKDSVKFLDTLITASPEFFDNKCERDYFQHAFDFMAAKVGETNIFSAVVHLDEKTPHMHLCFTPITGDGRLSAKEIIGNRAKLAQWQDDFYNHMQQHFDTLEKRRYAQPSSMRTLFCPV